MKIKSLLILLVSLIFSSCKGDLNSVNSASQLNRHLDTIVSTKRELPVLDTLIILSNTKNSYVADKPILEKEAEILLYKYYKGKRVENRNSINGSSEHLEDQLSVSFDTIYQIKTEDFSGAVISYWLGPADLNGHCFQPRKAVILNTHEGIVITNENFIPTNFTVDSAAGRIIFGYDYDCGGTGIVRYLKISLK